MIELKNEELEKIKNIELDILTEIDRICRENSIKYSLAYGTLLGAVRHKGFIPWDDDIDIMMLRDEYEKFLKIASQKINSKFYITRFEENKNYPIPFAKIMAKNTIMQETSQKYSKMISGVWVDVFPIDNAQENYKDKAKQYNYGQKIKSILFCKCNYYFGQKGLRKIEYRLRKYLFILFSHKFLVKKFNDNALKFKNEKTRDVIAMTGNAGVEKATLKKKWFDEYIELEFENKKFMVIKDYDLFLKKTYGDYMQLPDKSERIPHHYVEHIDIDKYYI